MNEEEIDNEPDKDTYDGGQKRPCARTFDLNKKIHDPKGEDEGNKRQKDDT